LKRFWALIHGEDGVTLWASGQVEKFN